jgi:serine/threonine-protein kinase RsbW
VQTGAIGWALGTVRQDHPKERGGSVEQTSITGEIVRLAVPASLEYVRIVRLTASGVASHLGFDVDELENLRVAVDELSSLVLEAAGGDGVLEVDFLARGDELRIEGRALAGLATSIAAEPLTAQILNAVIDEYELVVEDGYARFRCVRRLPAG